MRRECSKERSKDSKKCCRGLVPGRSRWATGPPQCRRVLHARVFLLLDLGLSACARGSVGFSVRAGRRLLRYRLPLVTLLRWRRRRRCYAGQRAASIDMHFGKSALLRAAFGSHGAGPKIGRGRGSIQHLICAILHIRHCWRINRVRSLLIIRSSEHGAVRRGAHGGFRWWRTLSRPPT